jgi:hypothetical protein
MDSKTFRDGHAPLGVASCTVGRPVKPLGTTLITRIRRATCDKSRDTFYPHCRILLQLFSSSCVTSTRVLRKSDKNNRNGTAGDATTPPEFRWQPCRPPKRYDHCHAVGKVGPLRPKLSRKGSADSEGLKTTSAKDHKESNKK